MAMLNNQMVSCNLIGRQSCNLIGRRKQSHLQIPFLCAEFPLDAWLAERNHLCWALTIYFPIELPNYYSNPYNLPLAIRLIHLARQKLTCNLQPTKPNQETITPRTCKTETSKHINPDQNIFPQPNSTFFCVQKKWQNLQSSTVVLSISNMEHHWAKLPAVNKSFLGAQAVAFHVRFPRADQKGHLELPEMVPGDVYRIPPRNHWAKYHGFLEMFRIKPSDSEILYVGKVL